MTAPHRKPRWKRAGWKLALRLIPPLIAYPLAITMLLAQSTHWRLEDSRSDFAAVFHAAARRLSALSRRKT